MHSISQFILYSAFFPKKLYVSSLNFIVFKLLIILMIPMIESTGPAIWPFSSSLLMNSIYDLKLWWNCLYSILKLWFRIEDHGLNYLNLLGLCANFTQVLNWFSMQFQNHFSQNFSTNKNRVCEEKLFRWGSSFIFSRKTLKSLKISWDIELGKKWANFVSYPI